jgi:protein-S-isoprenylcysteine O-methyltransferase Ste14
VPKSVERSTYVLLASLVLLLLYWQWRPIPGLVWSIDDPLWIAILNGVFWLGWAILLISTLLIDHFELFGLAQVYAAARKRELPPPVFRTPLFYKWVRHPLYLGFLLAFWSTPSMTWGHLLFAAGGTGYILLGIFLEERDLVALFGDQYRRYRGQVGMLLPWRRAAE